MSNRTTTRMVELTLALQYDQQEEERKEQETKQKRLALRELFNVKDKKGPHEDDLHTLIAVSHTWPACICVMQMSRTHSRHGWWPRLLQTCSSSSRRFTSATRTTLKTQR
jgi:hypothetical protein